MGRAACCLLLLILLSSSARAQSLPEPPPARIRTHADPVPPQQLPRRMTDPAAATPERLRTGRMDRPPEDRIGVNRTAQATPPRVVVFVLDRVGLSDIFQAKAPNLQDFYRRNAVGLMNFASAGGRTVEGSYATLSAGMHAAAPEEGGLFRNAGETFEGGSVRNAYLRRTGRAVEPGAVVDLGIAPLLRLNQERRTGATVGALGSFASHGGPTAVIGNSDSVLPDAPPQRFAPLIAMRPNGVVDRGDVSRNLLRPDPAAPFGVSTDLQKLEAAFRRYAPGASLVVVDLGETTRANEYREFLSEAVHEKHRLLALARADALFARLMRHIQTGRTRVVALTPFPPLPKEGQGSDVARLAPLAVSVGGTPPALLTSGTTQGAGLVANIDVAPSVAGMLWDSVYRFEYYGTRVKFPDRPATHMTGAPMTSAARPDALAYLRRLDAAVTAQRLAASGGLLVALALAEVAFGLLALAMVLRKRRTRMQVLLGRLALCALITMPLALVVAGEQMPASLPVLVNWTLLAWAGLSLVFLLVGRLAVPTAMLACGLALLADLYTGGTGLKLSPLSDFPIVGVRFHGLGNEYMGIAVGALLMGTSSLLDLIPPFRSRAGRALLLFLYGAAAATIGIPTLGDNAGGLIAATLAFGSLGLLLYGVPLKLRNLAGLFLLAFSALWILAVLDSARAGPTHFGRSLLLAQEGGAGYLLGIIARKLSLNLSFLLDPRSLLVYLGVGALLYLAMGRYRDRIRGVLSARPGLALGLRAALAGGLAAWVFNDTGVLPAVMIFAAGLAALLAAWLESPDSRPAPISLILKREE